MAGALAALGACSIQEELIGGVPASQIVEGYGLLEDGEYTLPPIPAEFLEPINQRNFVEYNGPDAAGTIVIDPHAKLLYLVEEDGMAYRYAIAVGRQGARMSRPSTVQLKREWPGLASPLGARALYLFQNGRDTHFRIHGTNDLPSIGNSGSAGCIRMFNHDIIDLYERVPNGTRVVVRSKAASVALEGEELSGRGVVLPPNIVDPDLIYGGAETPEGEDDAENDEA